MPAIQYNVNETETSLLSILCFISFAGSITKKISSTKECKNYSDCWDECTEEAKILSNYLPSKGISLDMLCYSDPISLVDTYDLTPAFINKLKSCSFFYSSLGSRAKELESAVNDRRKYLNLSEKVTLFPKEGEKKDVSLNNDEKLKIASYLATQDIKNLLRASFFLPPKSNSKLTDIESYRKTKYCYCSVQ